MFVTRIDTFESKHVVVAGVVVFAFCALFNKFGVDLVIVGSVDSSTGQIVIRVFDFDLWIWVGVFSCVCHICNFLVSNITKSSR